ncbi:MAG TPA: ABC transporter substrate-binding protein [Propionibacteriaceae bacterium]|nr:ABC transporter substrate-binding protein [Propionibacteriaceae bacterium]
MKKLVRSWRLAGAVVAASALLLTGCGGSAVNQAQPAGESSGGSAAACAPFSMAMNAWVGYTASASVVSYVAKEKLGCTVNQKDLNEQVAWQGFESGEIDVIIENWAHADLKKKYIETAKVAEIAGKNGNVGQIGWFVPPWMAEKYPDILDWQNLNKYADLFKTGESGDKGQLLDGDPAFVTNDAALVKNLNLNYKVVYSGSEAALITAFRDAEKNKKPLLGYFYSPQWFLAEVPLKMVKLPPYTEGCDADAQKVKCGYAEDQLDKIISTKFAQSGSPAVKLVRNFTWTNDDQNEVALSISKDKMSPEAAAKKWVDANPDKVEAWLK